jgi:hypothetical protein
MIEETLVTVLKAATTKEVIALKKPEGNNNCVVYKRISRKNYRSHSSSNGLTRYRYEFSCYGNSLLESRVLADRVVNVLDCNRTNFVLATFEDELDNDVVNGLYCRVIQFFIWE